MLNRIQSLQDVVDWGLCTGCGACASAATPGEVTLVNVESIGIRPQFVSATAPSARDLSFCPGYHLEGTLAAGAHRAKNAADLEFGPALEIWEGFSADSQIRQKASSGGLLSSLALYCLERENMAFVLHTGMDESEPWKNRTVQSRTREELLSRCGSRYAPASPCDSLRAIEESDRPCVFIGKPCDAAAVMMLRKSRPKLDRNLGLVLTFFCAGTPSTAGTLDLIGKLDVPLEKIHEVRYRGEGWPGEFKVRTAAQVEEKSLSYMKSWGHLTKYRPLRCHLCPDGLGQIADISCGDAWENFDNNGDPGRSLVLARSERGRELLHRAIEAGYAKLERTEAAKVLAAQPNLLERKKELLGRLLAMWMFLIPAPKYAGFSLLRSWLSLPLSMKARTVLGTVRRILWRGLWRRRPVFSRNSSTASMPAVSVCRPPQS